MDPDKVDHRQNSDRLNLQNLVYDTRGVEGEILTAGPAGPVLPSAPRAPAGPAGPGRPLSPGRPRPPYSDTCMMRTLQTLLKIMKK